MATGLEKKTIGRSVMNNNFWPGRDFFTGEMSGGRLSGTTEVGAAFDLDVYSVLHDVRRAYSAKR